MPSLKDLIFSSYDTDSNESQMYVMTFDLKNFDKIPIVFEIYCYMWKFCYRTNNVGRLRR